MSTNTQLYSYVSCSSALRGARSLSRWGVGATWQEATMPTTHYGTDVEAPLPSCGAGAQCQQWWFVSRHGHLILDAMTTFKINAMLADVSPIRVQPPSSLMCAKCAGQVTIPNPRSIPNSDWRQLWLRRNHSRRQQFHEFMLPIWLGCSRSETWSSQYKGHHRRHAPTGLRQLLHIRRRLRKYHRQHEEWNNNEAEDQGRSPCRWVASIDESIHESFNSCRHLPSWFSCVVA